MTSEELLLERLNEVRSLWVRNIGPSGSVETKMICREYWRYFCQGLPMPEWMEEKE